MISRDVLVTPPNRKEEGGLGAGGKVDQTQIVTFLAVFDLVQNTSK